MRPFIGVTCSAEPDGSPVIRPTYVRAIHEAGGLAVALPFLSRSDEAERILDRLDGLLLTGSEDLDSSLWSEPLHPLATLMHPNRQDTEMLLCAALLNRTLPVLAICGGMQNLAVAAGGSIHQHIPDLGAEILDHATGTQSDGPRHEVRARLDSRLARLLGDRFVANSAHHQAVAQIGTGMRAVAHAPDGVLEAYELDDREFGIAVQWHPEHMLGEGRQERLFQSLVATAAG